MLLKKRIMGVVITIILGLSIAGCTKKEENKEVISITDSLTQLAETKSFNSDMTIDMKMSTEGVDAAEIISTNKMSLIASPLLAKLEMGGTDAGAEFEKSEMYIQEENGVYTVYMQSMEGWMKQEFEKGFVEYALSQYDARIGFDNYMKATTNLKETGKEEIDGMATTKYDGVIPSAEVKKVMEATGILEIIGLLGLTDESFKGVNDIPISFWISDEENYPIKYNVDLTSTLQKIVENDNPDRTQKLTVSKYEVSTVCSDFNSLEVFELPEEVKNAIIYSSGTGEQNGVPNELESIEELQIPETTR